MLKFKIHIQVNTDFNTHTYRGTHRQTYMHIHFHVTLIDFEIWNTEFFRKNKLKRAGRSARNIKYP